MLEDLVRVLTETRCPFLEGCRCLFERKGKGSGLEARGPWTQIVKSTTRIPSKSDHMTFVHQGTRCEIPPSPPLLKGGTKTPPFVKGAARKRGGISVRDCANLVWFDLV
jgi:hypothetical protein